MVNSATDLTPLQRTLLLRVDFATRQVLGHHTYITISLNVESVPQNVWRKEMIYFITKVELMTLISISIVNLPNRPPELNDLCVSQHIIMYTIMFNYLKCGYFADSN